MATSLIHNALQVNFESVLSFSDEGMVAMSKALESTGIRGFLGCPFVLYEQDLESFFSNATVYGDSVISCIQSKYVEIPKNCLLGAPDLTLGEAKTFPHLKILKVKTVGTYVAKNNNITAEEDTDDPPVDKVVKKAVAKRRLAPAVAEPAAKNKRTTAASPSARRCRAPKRKLVLQESDVEEIFAKVIKETAEIEMEETETVEPVVMETIEMETVETKSRIDVSSITNYDEVISFQVLSNEEGPLVEEKEKEKDKETKKETADKRKRVEKIIDSEDTEPLRKSHSLKAMQSVSDLDAKEEQMLAWAETDSLQTVVQRRVYIIAKYREMLLRKFLAARHKNFESSTPTTAIDLQVLDMLSEAHRLALTKLVEQMRQHKLEWTRPCNSEFFGKDDVQSDAVLL
ncbi:hypothetical protein F511_37913 [Dorcoceras hygrometricum]|uniref:Uncharacterized protein n=1 Tax=Dorcoceras hygrometricum TaxID=472368 RepID=A0A2Z7CXB5_9LAMI|nr:hypothetical protein F511_37913 [Dorcoceras hygrometricum]